MRIIEAINESIALKQEILSSETLITNIGRVADFCIGSLRNGGKVLLCGNGGSAADAQHLAAELSGRFYFDREPLFSEALHVNTSFLTAVGNDYGYDQVFSRMVRASGRAGDVLIGLSTSGNSQNVINAFLAASERKMFNVAFTGKTGGKMKDLANILINVPSDDTPRIQEAHIRIGHIICEIIESEMFSQK